MKKILLFTLFLVKSLSCASIAEKNLGSDLIDAVLENNIEAVDDAISNGANVNAVDKYGQTALHWAVSNNPENLTIIKKLLKLPGLNINAIDNEGATPLTLAVLAKNNVLATLLLDAGANPNVGFFFKGKQNLLKKFHEQNDEIVLPLLKHGNINNPEVKQFLESEIRIKKVGLTPFMIALRGDDIDIVKKMIEKSADVQGTYTTILEVDGKIVPKSESILYLIKNKLIKNLVNPYTPLHFAARSGYIPAIEQLLKANPNIFN